MNVLLLSSYELGRQPVHIASPAASLKQAGHDIRAVDTSLDELQTDDLDWAEAVAISVPMHTAKRIGDDLTVEISSYSKDLPVAHYGLYAGVGDEDGSRLVDAVFEGEYEPGLIRWVSDLQNGNFVSARHTGRSEFVVPDRSVLPSLDRYAHLEYKGESIVVGAVEASHGCRHRCRHCPIPVVYDGRMRVVPQDVVLGDIDRLVSFGARHITFGDPDFLNAPAHSVSILEQAHSSHPDITFDATVKVEHILRHIDLWPRLAEQNLLFVVSAFESVDEATLDILDKGHTVDDMVLATETLRDSGIHVRPTWLPFVPWTKPHHVASLLRFITDNDLVSATDPVQLAIKLLIPEGSLLEDHPAVTPHLIRYDAEALTWQWSFAEPDVAVLHKELSAIAADASECGQEATPTLQAIWKTTAARLDLEIGALPQNGVDTPRLTESWFCCAEPTESQAVSLKIGGA